MNAQDTKTQNWSGTGQLRGGRWGIWFFITAIRVLGLRATYALAVFPAIYFSFASPDIAATMDFHRRISGPLPWWKRRWFIFKHFYSFGRAIIDRTAILAGKKKHFTFFFDGEKNLRDALAQGRGVLLLAAHVGNWEAGGQLLARVDVPINITGFDNESDAIRSLLKSSSKTNFQFLPLTGSPTDTIPLVAALRRGEIVAMLGDRSYGGPSTQTPFFGSPAAFPVGAYVMAAISGAPLIHAFSLRERGGHYRFFGFPPQYLELPVRNERDAYLKKCAAAFAHNLETIVRRDPFQWYNFYPFWNLAAPPQLTPKSRTQAKMAQPADALTSPISVAKS